jgi:hypothetical protein
MFFGRVDMELTGTKGLGDEIGGGALLFAVTDSTDKGWAVGMGIVRIGILSRPGFVAS